MDMLGHLNQSAYHELLEEGRVALIGELIRRTDGLVAWDPVRRAKRALTDAERASLT